MVDDSEDDHVFFVAIIWKHSQTVETIGTIEGYPRNHHFYSSQWRINSAWTALKSKKKYKNVCTTYGRYLKLAKLRNIKFSK